MTAIARINYELESFDQPLLDEVLDFIGYLKARSVRADAGDNPLMDGETWAVLEDARLGRNLYGPYKTAEDAVAAMLGE
jgi:hypothetical protein